MVFSTQGFKFLKLVDIFGIDTPKLNLRGKHQVRTDVGGVTSLFVMIILLLFSVLKFEHLTSKHNPQVNTYVQHDALNGFRYYLNDESGFMVAFAFENHFTYEPLLDPRFVKFFA